MSEQHPLNADRTQVTRGSPACGHVTNDELLRIANELGLGGRVDEVEALARRSLRLTMAPAEDRRSSHFGDDGARPADLTLPAGAEDALLLARIDLAQAALLLGSGDALPPAGMLWCFRSRSPVNAMERIDTREFAVMVHMSEGAASAPASPAEHATTKRARAAELSAELQLPRVWSAAVQALELDAAEHKSWESLREHLADRQGIHLHDRTIVPEATHRLLGYPDERRGDMPLACELLAHGHALGCDPPLAHPYAAEFDASASRWRLLLQLSADDELGWSWGGRHRRLYVWVDASDLASHDFSRIRALAQ